MPDTILDGSGEQTPGGGPLRGLTWKLLTTSSAMISCCA